MRSRKSMTDSQSVTCVTFAKEFSLISAGSTDGVIKLWDVRKLSSCSRKHPQPVTCFPYKGTSRKQCGFSDLALDSHRSRLYASCLDHTIYEYDLNSPSTRPMFLYTGHLTSSFYIKMSVSPDDAYLVCGSADSRAYIYTVGERSQHPLVLSGHSGEVSVPSWCPGDPTRLVTLSDSAQLFVWRMFPARAYTIPEPGDLMGLTERLSRPTMTADTQTTLLVPASPRKPVDTACLSESAALQSLSTGTSPYIARRRRQLNIRDFLLDMPLSTASARPPILGSVISRSDTTCEPLSAKASIVCGSRIVHRYPSLPTSSGHSLPSCDFSSSSSTTIPTSPPSSKTSTFDDAEVVLASPATDFTDENTPTRPRPVNACQPSSVHHRLHPKRLFPESPKGSSGKNPFEPAPTFLRDVTNSKVSLPQPVICKSW
uniref:WD_REPEATS_REGION domain-containing protein n=1 Tax=Mesocestoides corti TaxID=53468 RepID=A0A5K3FD29_MESCO